MLLYLDSNFSGFSVALWYSQNEHENIHHEFEVFNKKKKLLR